MADTTDVLALPFPEGSDANDVAGDMAALAARLDEVPGVESLTGAEIAALGAALKPAGRVVFNSTTGKAQISNGTTFTDIDAAAIAAAAAAQSTANAALPKAGGTMTGGLTMSGATIAMGSQKITGLAAGNSNGEAVAFEQLGTWATWSPTLTMSAGSPVNWTAAGRYHQIGKLVTATFQITFSSGIGTSTGAVLRLSYPVAPATAAVTLSDYVAGMVWMRDNSETKAWQGGIRLATTSYMHFALISSFQSVTVADNVPCGWSTSDSIVGQLVYEAA